MKHLITLVFVFIAVNAFACLEKGKLEVVDKGEYHEIFLSEQPKKNCHWYGNVVELKVKVFFYCVEGDFTEVVEMGPHDTLYYQLKGDIIVASRCIFKTTQTTLSIDNHNVCVTGNDDNYCVEEWIDAISQPFIAPTINAGVQGGTLSLEGQGYAVILSYPSLNLFTVIELNNSSIELPLGWWYIYVFNQFEVVHLGTILKE